MLRSITVSGLVIVLIAVSSAQAEPGPTEVQAAVDSLNAFVGNGSNGQRWRAFLKADALAAELAKGDGADPAAVESVIAKYSGNQNGLANAKFQAVRTALVAWHEGLAKPAPVDLPTALKEAKFTPIHADEVAQAKAELATAASQLEAMLNRSGSRVAAGWKKHLGWDNLVAVLASDQPPAPGVIYNLVKQFRANHNGLEMKQFLRAREALQNYAALAGAAADAKLADDFQKQVDLLTKHLDAYEKNPASGDDALAAARAAGTLSKTRQAGGLVKAIAQRFRHPNMFGSASRKFVAAGIEDIVDQTSRVNDNILGTSLFGVARLTGRTSLIIDENPNAASFNILLAGNAFSNSTGYNGPVTIHSTAVTGVSASKQISMDADGMKGAGPAAASARTNSKIHSISAKHGFVEKIAWKRAGQQKGQAEAIGSSHAAARVAGQMNQQAGKMIAEQNAKYEKNFKKPLLRRGEFPEDLHFSSGGERMYVRMLQTGPEQLAAPGEPPAHDADHDLAVQLHESGVVNQGEAVLGGYELTDLELERIIRDDLKGEVSDELRVTLPDGTLDPDKDPWSIVFNDVLPVRAKFQDGGLWMAIRAKQFNRGQDPDTKLYQPAIKELVEIAADYKIERTDKGATLRRQGDVQVRFPQRANPDQITIRDSPIVTFMRRKFRSMFKEEFVGEGLKFKGNWEKAGTLALKELACEKAWLVAGWDMPANPPAAATTTAGGEE